MKAQVLLPKVFNFPFTYNTNTKSKIGDLVEVPFGSKKEIGVIWKNKYAEPENITIKDIKKSTGYSINSKLIDFIEWFSSYNMVPLGLVLKMVIGGADKFIKFISDFHKAGKVIACICSGVQLLISAKVVKGKKIAGYYHLEDDITNAGAIYTDLPAVVDSKIITTAHYKDMGPWMRATLDFFNEKKK